MSTITATHRNLYAETTAYIEEHGSTYHRTIPAAAWIEAPEAIGSAIMRGRIEIEAGDIPEQIIARHRAALRYWRDTGIPADLFHAYGYAAARGRELADVRNLMRPQVLSPKGND